MKTSSTTIPLPVRPPPPPPPPAPPPAETPSSVRSGSSPQAPVATSQTSPAVAKPAPQTGDPRLQARLQADTFTPAVGRKPLSLSGENESPVRPFAGVASGPGVATRYTVPDSGGTYQLSSEDRDSAERAIVDGFDRDDAQPLVDWLRDHPKPEDQAAFIDVLFQFGPGAADALNSANTLYDSDQQLLADSLNAAYEKGLVTDQEIQNAVVPAGHGAPYHEAHEDLGDVLSRTQNPGLITAYATRELEVARESDGLDLARVDGAARALAGLRPEDLQDYLANNPDDVEFLVENFNEATEGSYGNPEALGDLLKNAADIQPPTEESLALFGESIAQLGDNPASREGAAEFFIQNTDAVLARYTDASGSLTLEGQEKLGHFFGQTLFSEPVVANQEQLQAALLGKMEELSDTLAREPDTNRPSTQAQEAARLLGSLVGTVEGGFQFAVDELDQKNEATAGVVDFFFNAGSLIPDLPFPGGGLVKDLTVDQLQEWVTDSLTEDAKEAHESLPFHAAFSQGIDNPALRTAYDAARGDVFQNVVKELID